MIASLLFQPLWQPRSARERDHKTRYQNLATTGDKRDRQLSLLSSTVLVLCALIVLTTTPAFGQRYVAGTIGSGKLEGALSRTANDGIVEVALEDTESSTSGVATGVAIGIHSRGIKGGRIEGQYFYAPYEDADLSGFVSAVYKDFGNSMLKPYVGLGTGFVTYQEDFCDSVSSFSFMVALGFKRPVGARSEVGFEYQSHSLGEKPIYCNNGTVAIGGTADLDYQKTSLRWSYRF